MSSVSNGETQGDTQAVAPFHPDQNLPGCMMPDGGECCAGHAAVCADWHRQRAKINALRAEIAELKNIPVAQMVCGACGEPWQDGMSCGQKNNGWPFPTCYMAARVPA